MCHRLEKYSWTPEDVIFQELASEFLIRRQQMGRVGEEHCGQRKDERVSNLYLSSLTEERSRANAWCKYGSQPRRYAFGRNHRVSKQPPAPKA